MQGLRRDKLIKRNVPYVKGEGAGPCGYCNGIELYVALIAKRGLEISDPFIV